MTPGFGSDMRDDRAVISAEIGRATQEAMSRAVDPVRVSLSIAGHLVDIVFSHAHLVDHFMPALEHRTIGERLGEPSLTVHVWDSESSGVPVPVPPSVQALDTATHGGVGARVHWSFSRADGVLLLHDAHLETAAVCVPSRRRLMDYDRSMPFLTVFQWFLLGRGSMIVHAGAVGASGRAALLVGAGGAGKSTTVLSCVRRGMEFFGDDLVGVTPGPPVLVHGLFGSAKSEWTSLESFPTLAGTQINDPQSPGKAIHMIGRVEGAVLPESSRLSVVVLLDRFTPGPRLSRVDATEVLQVLASSTYLIQRVPAERLVMGLARVLRAVPIVRLRLVEDMDSNATAVAECLSGEFNAVAGVGVDR